MILPKLIITDIDGVWTDGSMYYDNFENELKRFHTYDSAGILFSKLLDIKTLIITGEQTNIVDRRAKKVNVDFLIQGSKNKLSEVLDLIGDLGIGLADCAFIGDDINDVQLLREVGFSACTQNAADYIKKEVDFVTGKKGGEGAFREFVEYILKENNLLEHVVEKAIANLKKSN